VRTALRSSGGWLFVCVGAPFVVLAYTVRVCTRKLFQLRRDYIRTYIIPGKSRTCEKDDAPYLADKNPSKYRARFVIFKEKPL